MNVRFNVQKCSFHISLDICAYIYIYDSQYTLYMCQAWLSKDLCHLLSSLFMSPSPPLTMKSLDTLHNPSAVESGNAAVKNVDDDGREKRTGTFLTASAHIITAVIGSGVLSLAWALAQLGWVAGTMILVIFAIITYYTSTLLADCYRAPDPITGTRNYTYMGVVRAYLGMQFITIIL